MPGIRAGSASTSANASGWRSSAFIALPIRLVVVSLPAISSRTVNDITSSALNASPSSACTSTLIRSSSGRRRRSSAIRSTYAVIASAASRTSSAVNAPEIPDMPSTIASDQCLNSARRSRSTPSSSAITVTGSGIASSGTRSIRPFGTAVSMQPTAISRMRGSSSAMRRGVKPRFTSLRRRA